ncbi:transposase [Brevibacillus agri]|nr:transposase [Brevibacillus agri]
MSKENRWVKLARLVPWAHAEKKYAKSFRKSFRGQKAVSIRVALGALIIQERLQLSDRETVQQIVENPYLQYFIGLEGYQDHPPFHPSLMTHFRKFSAKSTRSSRSRPPNRHQIPTVTMNRNPVENPKVNVRPSVTQHPRKIRTRVSCCWMPHVPRRMWRTQPI